MLRVAADHFHVSDTGRARKLNEDRWFARAPLFGVADGMGGANAGEVASQMAVEVFEAGLPDGEGSPEERLAGLLVEANRRIHAAASQDAELAGMGTTTTVAWVGDDELAIAHVGDSRLYCLRGGVFNRITRDHSLVEDLVQQGHITAAEADQHPQSNIVTRVLGPFPDVDVDHLTFPGRADDIFLICSDGLTGMVPEQRVGSVLREAPSLRGAGRRLVELANAAGGKDNITIVLFRLEEVGAGPPTGEATLAGATAPQTAEIRAALAAEPAPAVRPRPAITGAPAPAPADPPAPAVPPRAPRAPEAPPKKRFLRRNKGERRGLGILRTLGFFTIFGVPILLGAYFASQSVYFVATNGQGFVTLYRGVPYKLPLGISLYSENFESGVPTGELAPKIQHQVSDHNLRTRKDGADYVSQIERGTLDTGQRK